MGATHNMALTQMDLQQLMQDPSPSKRAQVADKVTVLYHQEDISKREKEIALEILYILTQDIEVAVRRAVALSLADSLTIPHDLVLRLANDVADVASPILQYSNLLTEEDLIQIVRSTQDALKLVHIAKRESLSSNLSDALLECREQKATYTLLHNGGANIPESALLRHWDSLSATPTLMEALVHRGNLPVAIAEKLFALVSDELKQHLAKNYKLPMTLVEDNIEDIREWTTLGMLMPDDAENGLEEGDLEVFIDQLYMANRLTYSMVIRALCTGDLAFFESAMARLAGVPRFSARLLMFDSGPLGFKAFYEKANMPPAFFDAIRTTLKLALEITAYGRVKRGDFRQRIVDRIYKDQYDKTVENMQYLLTVIGGHFASKQTVH